MLRPFTAGSGLRVCVRRDDTKSEQCSARQCCCSYTVCSSAVGQWEAGARPRRPIARRQSVGHRVIGCVVFTCTRADTGDRDRDVDVTECGSAWLRHRQALVLACSTISVSISAQRCDVIIYPEDLQIFETSNVLLYAFLK